ncbi:MAG: GIY-YIG nuclease family protein [Elusimicrobia bacterium]|nr:GIY-YIG nuclease family protein [Elusimicrobiota bacterium]
MTSDDQKEIKKCISCRSLPRLPEEFGDDGLIHIDCVDCGVGVTGVEYAEAIKNWNMINLSDFDIFQEALNILRKWYPQNSQQNKSATSHEEETTESHSSINGAGFVYIAHTKNTSNYKIGSSKNVAKRHARLKTGNPHLIVIATKLTANRLAEERMLHRIYASSRIGGEWFSLTSEQISEAISLFGFNYCIEAQS